MSSLLNTSRVQPQKKTLEDRLSELRASHTSYLTFEHRARHYARSTCSQILILISQIFRNTFGVRLATKSICMETVGGRGMSSRSEERFHCFLLSNRAVVQTRLSMEIHLVRSDSFTQTVSSFERIKFMAFAKELCRLLCRY